MILLIIKQKLLTKPTKKKYVSDGDEGRKEYMKNYYYKRSKLDCVINCVEELENVCFSR